MNEPLKPQNNQIEPEVLDMIKDLGFDYLIPNNDGTVDFGVKVINHSPNALPKLATAGSAGFDISVDFTNDVSSDVMEDENGVKYVTHECGVHRYYRTGLHFGFPFGMEMQLRPRSGMGNKRGLIIPNSPATIDSDYTGEIIVGMYNLGYAGAQKITQGDRICQAVFASVVTNIQFNPVTTLEKTGRGSGGFGHTGK